MPSSPRVASPGLLGAGTVVTLADGTKAYAFYNEVDFRKEYVKQLVRGDVYGLPNMDGSMWTSYKRFVGNNHPILSICLADEDHPFSRTERLITNFAYFSWAFFVTACFSANKDMPWWVTSFIVTALTVPYSVLLKVLAECGCIQHHDNRSCFKSCLEGCGRCALAIFSILAVVYIGLGISLFIQFHGVHKIPAWALSLGQSWCVWFVYWSPFFLLKFRWGKEAFIARFPADCVAITAFVPGGAGGPTEITVVPMTPVTNPATQQQQQHFASPRQASPPPLGPIITNSSNSPPPALLSLSPKSSNNQKQQQQRSSSPRPAPAGASPPPPHPTSPVQQQQQQQQQQPLPPAPPMAVRAMQVVIPHGVVPGTPITVLTPEGAAITLIIQPNHIPGTALLIAY